MHINNSYIYKKLFLQKNIEIKILICFTILAFSYSFIATNGNWYPLSDRYATNNLFFAENLVENGEFYYVNPLNVKYDPIFVPDCFVQEGEKTLPFGFYGFIFLLSMFYFISEKLVWISVPLTGLVGLMAFYILVSMIFDKKTAIISSFLLAFSPAYLYYVNFFVADIPAFMFLIFAIIYFLRVTKNPERLSNYILFPLFFAWSVLCRYPNVLLLAAFIPSLFLLKRKLKIKYVALGLLTFLIFIGPFFVLNAELFGGPFNIGIRSPHVVLSGGSFAAVEIPQEASLLSSIFIPQKSFETFSTSSIVYIVKFSPLIFMLFILSLFLVFRLRNKLGERKKQLYHFILISLLMTLIIIFYYAGGEFGFSGYSKPIIQASMARYFILIYAIFIIFASFLITKFNKFNISRYFIPLVVLVLISSSFSFVFAGNGIEGERTTLSYSAKYSSEVYDIREYIKENTEDDAVIFTKYSFSMFFPERNVANYLLYSKEDNVNETTQLVIRLINDGKPVYFLKEDYYWLGPKSDQYFSSFEEHGLSIDLVKDFKFSGYYSRRPIFMYKLTGR